MNYGPHKKTNRGDKNRIKGEYYYILYKNNYSLRYWNGVQIIWQKKGIPEYDEYLKRSETKKYQKSYQKSYRKKKDYKEKANIYRKKWRDNNVMKRYYNDPVFKLKRLIRGRMKSVLKRQKASKNERTLDYVGCSVAELYSHLKSQFTPDMNWNNMGKDDGNGGRGWEIDHRRPCASFDLNDEEQKHMCFHWTNLQPMWGEENNKKSDKYCQETFPYKWCGKERGWVKQ